MPKKLRRSPKQLLRLINNLLSIRDTLRSKHLNSLNRKLWPISRLASKLRRRTFNQMLCHQRRESQLRSQLPRKLHQSQRLLSNQLSRRLLQHQLPRRPPSQLRRLETICQSKTRYSKLRNSNRLSRPLSIRRSRTTELKLYQLRRLLLRPPRNPQHKLPLRQPHKLLPKLPQLTLALQRSKKQNN
jgi:hypothetical protein